MSRRNCTSRAEWRLQTGKPAEALSAHYRLDCDYGTAVIVCWEEGGSEPIYVCESHAKELGNSREHCPDVRLITPQSDNGNKPIKSEDRKQTQEAAVIEPKGSALSKAAGSLAEPKVGRAKTEPIKREHRKQTQKAAVIEPKGSASLEAARSLADVKVGRAITEPSLRSPARDLTYGNSAKAMVDEVIWNMAPGDYPAYRNALEEGKSAAEAAQAAGGQLAVIHRKISDYTVKLEAVLSKSKTTINVAEAIDKPLEQAVVEIISNGAMNDLEKDAAIQQLGTLQEWVKQDLERDITPVQANQIILAIGDRLNWGGTTGVSEDFKPVYRALYGSLKTAIRTAVPDAQNLHDRLTNLYAAKSGIAE